jgi:hypothetical protein
LVFPVYPEPATSGSSAGGPEGYTYAAVLVSTFSDISPLRAIRFSGWAGPRQLLIAVWAGGAEVGRYLSDPSREAGAEEDVLDDPYRSTARRRYGSVAALTSKLVQAGRLRASSD